jgi:Caspase domain
MRSITRILIAALCCIAAAEAKADKRVALIFGNSKYQHVPNLLNPASDAKAVKTLFEGAGFDVVQKQSDTGVNDMRRAVRDFTDQTRDADIAVIYYAGHGIEVNGVNYLVPVDATLRRDIDVEDETVSLDRLLQVLEPAKRLRLIILDACRDNPFTKSMTRTMASRSVGRGLARVEPTSSDTLIAFAAKAGSTAADGDGIHSPFTTALLKYLVTPGLDIRLAFGRVRDEVMKETSNKQEPFVYGSLGGNTVTLASLSKDDRTDVPVSGDPDAPAARDYEAATKVGSVEGWDSFLAKHPVGFYSDLARVQRAKIVAPPLPIATTKQKPAGKADGPSSQTKPKSTGDASGMTDRQMLSAMQSPIGSRSWCAANRVWLERTARAGKMGTIEPSFPALFRLKCGG